MKRLILLLVSLCSMASAQTYTLYVTDNVDQNGRTDSITAEVSGDDGGYCGQVWDSYETNDVPRLMLNGNAWVTGPIGTHFNGSAWVDFAYTFPKVTLSNSDVDISVGAQITGRCTGLPGSPSYGYSFAYYNFYAYPFVDGTAPNSAPAPCWIVNGFSPACPNVWPSPEVGYHNTTIWNLASLKIPKLARLAFTYLQNQGACGCGSNLYNVRPWCTLSAPATDPPLYAPTQVLSAINAAYWWMAATCFKVGGQWGCQPLPVANWNYSPDLNDSSWSTNPYEPRRQCTPANVN